MSPHSLPAPARGFTLLEILVSLAIVILLAGLGWNGYRHIVQKAARAEGRAALLHVLMQQERHHAYQHRYKAFQPGSAAHGFKWYSGATPQASAYALAARACDDEDLSSCVLVTATPGGSGVNTAYEDARCGVLQADSRGNRRADGKDCW
ncbi:prepilin-type N-terminal cleavage/methylation domain-containing protein [Herbaspirillum sp. DW155]|uniref:type IV pilin protein n=1 Tax=Herbaspirillum sp. DW155 TaxID=3095609 RepID=UPI003088B871|nr:prepilin-type N-terminal cleavage/methylation domain-containing protein [Herbaspirillum sp. DW155]